ncbi:MAG: AbrB family transcriptional regulator [Candidatus Portnoybacteria bacterium CG10_big_fil_rev_8_21_14_0_10_44_7]|uniref:AbrB family transcriptional regulator n=1 Tax=Candidatus Portnoybacteria bacterium CG10_big_fil_rev_8_21_14_0_10_44_7 TaxID=1974816 RepID=A0A2M8KIC4_9BACT|nr:MAG: AbrB family transcriptional regulator [Candidatus Portnoybacteria bacterium CG10_big_fil_rev_8_21_14_0_10_44_7]
MKNHTFPKNKSMEKINIQLEFCGVATLGQRGQIVIPASARKKLKIKKGDKLIVLSKDKQVLAIMKTETLSKSLNQIARPINKILKQIKL